MIDFIILTTLAIYIFFIIFLGLILFFAKRKLYKDKNNKEVNIYYMKSLNFLNIIYMTSPFLGLIGTVNRILNIFKDKTLFVNNPDAFSIIVFNLGLALEVTIYGIISALFALIIYLYYKNEFKVIWFENEFIR